MIVPSLSLTSRSSQRKCWRFCTHSKYETTTPPAFAITSGTTWTPLSARIASAFGVVGLLAPSAIILHLSRSAALVDHAAKRRRDEDVALDVEQLVRLDLVDSLEL